MFREMRRFKNGIPREAAIGMLESCSNGVLSVFGDDGYPYGVPVSYTYSDNKIYFHSAVTGHKLDAIAANPKVCFTVVAKDDIKPADFTTRYESTIVFGRAHVADEVEKKEGLEQVIRKYSKDFIPEGIEYMNRDWNKTTVVVIDIDHMTGKKGGQG